MSPHDRESAPAVPAWPVVVLALDVAGRATVDGRVLTVPDEVDPQARLLAEATRRAADLGRPLRVRASDPVGVWNLVAYPDGAVVEVPDELPDEPTDDGLTDDEPTVNEADDDLDVPDDDGPWHLRVHPNGVITPMDELPLPTDEDYVPRPTSGWLPVDPAPIAPAAPAASAAFDPEPDDEPVALPAEPEAVAPSGSALLIEEPEPVADPEADADPEPFAEPEADAESEAEPVTEPEAVEEAPEPAAETPFWQRPAEASDTPAADTPAADPPASDRWPSDLPAVDPPTSDPPESDLPTSDRPNAAESWYDLADPPPLLGRDLPEGPDPDDLVHDLRATAEAPPPERSHRWIPLAVATTLGVLAVGGIAVVVQERSSPSATTSAQGAVTGSVRPSGGASSSAGVPSAGVPSVGVATGAAAAAPSPVPAPPTLAAPPTALDIGAPPGFSAKPVWALPVAGSGSATVSAAGLVVTLTADRQVALVDPATGAVRWHGAVPADAAGPYLSRIDGTSVVALLTPSRLLYWPLSGDGTPKADVRAPVEVPLPPGSAVTWAGPSPLVALGDGTAAVVVRNTVQRVSLPTGARPLAADGTEVIAVNGRNWIRQRSGETPGAPKVLSTPDGATGDAPIRVENVGGSFLGAMWAGPNGPIVAVYDARSGERLVQATFPKDVNFTTAPTVREIGSERTTVGSALFEPAQRNLSILASSFTPVALAPGHVFANDVSGAVADLQIKGKDLKALPFPARNPAVPVGIATAGSRALALVVVPHGSGWVLAALPPG